MQICFQKCTTMSKIDLDNRVKELCFGITYICCFREEECLRFISERVLQKLVYVRRTFAPATTAFLTKT